MMAELRAGAASSGSAQDFAGKLQGAELAKVSGSGAADDDEDYDSIDPDLIDRSGQVVVLGVPNSGKSSLVNALVGTKVSIVSPKPQTTRQRVMGLALLSPRPGAPPNTQAVFLDTAGIMAMEGQSPDEVVGGAGRRRRKKSLFPKSRLHKAMVKTAWRSTKVADALWWVLDAGKCCQYGDYMPAVAELDGVAIGPPVRDAWWMHPELAEELSFMRRLKKVGKKVHVILNKVDLLREVNVDVESFALMMRERLLEDLGEDENGEDLLQNIWPTSAAFEPDSLIPLKVWLCENLPKQDPLYPLAAVSDVPARVAASEITREKLFNVLREELPYHTSVINAVWRESPEGSLSLGQRIVVTTEGQARIVKGCLRKITEEAEQEISQSVNLGRPVALHFQVSVEPSWQDSQEYYSDVQGLLHESGSLLFPE